LHLALRLAFRYNQNAMYTEAGILRTLLFATLIGLAWIGVAFLRRRRLSPTAFLLWGLFALCLPALGPFLILWLRPGRRI